MGGQAKARKRRRNLKTKMPQKNRSKFIKPVFTSNVVRQHWDNTLSAKKNLAKLGLATQGNEVVGDDRGRTKAGDAQAADATQFFDVPESDNLAAIDHNPRRRIMSEEDQSYVAKQLAAHGQDYKAMVKDIETNWMQYTENKLRKLCSRFLLLDESQRLVPIPEGVMVE